MTFTPDQMQWLEQQFERCLPWIEAALRKPRQPYGSDFIRSEVMTGNAQLWPSDHAVVVTKIEAHEDGSRSVFGWIAGGDRKEIEQLTERALAWAKPQGCTKARTIQRMGFLKKPLRGFRPVSVVMERDI